MGPLKKEYARFSLRRKRNDVTIQDQHAELLQGARPSASYKMTLNSDQDDQFEICGYKTSTIKTALTYSFIFLTAGILRLIYHWVPHWFLKSTAVPCPIKQAQYILITELYNGKHKIYHVKPLRVLTPESVQKLKSDDDVLNHHHVTVHETPPSLSVHFSNGVFKELDQLLLFRCKKVTYIWDEDKHEFVRLAGLDQNVCADVLHSNKGLSNSEQFMRRLVYGPNKILVKGSSVVKLLLLEVLNPYYIFQILSFILWFYDSYYYYAGTILFMAIYSVSSAVKQTRENQRNLKSTVHSSDVCTVLRKSSKNDSGDYLRRTEVISTDLLVPGDVLEIPTHGCIMHCDAVLLAGNCILNESMLTGESVPVTKTPLPNLPELIYDPKEHARHTLFCGTHVIQTRYFGDEKVLAVVVRTGFSTAKGGLVRSILYPPPVDFRFEKDSYKFVALLATIATVGFVYTIITKYLRGVDTNDLILEALDLITIVVPPALPAAMTVGRVCAQKRLKKNQIFCIAPRTINVAGSIDCVCFDKTGTLTEDGLDLLCVVPIREHRFQEPVKRIETLPYDTLVCGLVSCHSLITIDNQLIGDPLDLKMFENTKWTMEEIDVADNTKFNMIYPTVIKPPKNRHNTTQPDIEIGIIREFPFSSSAQRMGVIIRKRVAQHFEYYCKGSPEMIINFVKKETIPDDFYEILESYAQEGYRVIAMAHKELKLSYTKVSKVQRDVIENEMTLLGLIVFENRLKPETTDCIQHLNNANIRVVMVTGDNILTALSVAKDCDIITHGQSVITANVDANNSLYFTLTNTKNKIPNDLSVLSNSASIVSMETLESATITTNNTHEVRPVNLFNNYRFAMTGKVWSVVRENYADLIPRLVTRGSVFARMSPEQKQQLVQELQALGYCVAMCGDGANDCGALKAAHTGISLSEAESSVASPFTSKNPNIECVLKVIKEGRAALVTSSGIFKYIAAYSLCQFVSVMILYSLESNLTDFEFLYIDLFIISVCTFLFGKTEAYKGKLVKDTPLSSLISLSPILSLALQLFVIIFFQVTAFEYLKMQDWYEPFDATAKENKDSVGCLENYVIFTVSSFQCIILAIVFTKGKPYRASIFTNWGLITTTILLATFSTYLALYPSSFLQQQFELILPKNFHFRLFLIIYALINFLISMFVEEILIDRLVFKKLRFKCHNVNKSKRKYLAIERDLNLDTKWPVLSSEYHSAASPLNLLPNCTAEIVIETECKFDKNHVLNGLFESATATPIESPKSLSSVYESFDSASESQTISSFNMLGRSPQSNGVNNKHYSNMELNNFEMQSSVALQIDDNNENSKSIKRRLSAGAKPII